MKNDAGTMFRSQKNLNRRDALTALLGISVLGMGGRAVAARPGMADFWPTYRDRFVKPDGRVIDSYNKGVSHSESQGWGLLLAAAASDWKTFDRIWDWTDKAFGWAGAPLFAWRWDPAKGEVSDPNDASDGDILIAWALLRAGVARKQPKLIARAKQSMQAIKKLLVASHNQNTILLPGFYGFGDGKTVTINLSYYVFPAFWHFAHVDGDPIWRQLSNDGAALARVARFGRNSLPPDWLDSTSGGQLQPAKDWPARFGFDAIRVPLYLFWAGFDSDADLGVYRRAWRTTEKPLAYFALDEKPDAKHPASDGVLAMRDLIEGQRPADALLWSAVKEGEYYAASLAMLALLAAEDRGLR
jgi:endo-1,4-beta-D-glucanase Y